MRIRNMETVNGFGNVEGRKVISELLETGLEAADPYYNACDFLRIEDGVLYVGHPDFDPLDSPRTGVDRYVLGRDIDRIFVFGAGKGIWRAISALEERLGDYLTGGHVILKHGDEGSSEKIGITRAGHPVPDEFCVEGCKAILKCIKEAKLTSRDIVFTIIGNGVSSLLTLPPEGVSLEDVKTITRVIQIEHGLPTTVLNKVRNQVDQLKGGRITRLLHPAIMYHLVTIDVNEKNRFNLQGYRALTETNTWLHTLPDMTTPEDALAFLKDNGLWDEMAPSVQDYLENRATENPVLTKAEFETFHARIAALMPNGRSCVPRILAKAKELGYTPHWMTKQLFQDAGVVSNVACSIAKNTLDEKEPFQAPCLLLFTGELLVTVGKSNGIGGRNQEFCLTAATAIAGRKRIVVGSADTDGTDGPGGRFNEDAWEKGCHGLSGGIVDGYTMERAAEKGVDVADALRTHATSDALWKLDCGLWATQNISINDIIMVLVMDHDG